MSDKKVLRTATNIVASGGLYISFAIKALESEKDDESDKIKEIRNLEKAILGVASGQYLLAQGLKTKDIHFIMFVDQ